MFLWAQSDQHFFDLMQSSARNILEATELFRDMVSDMADCDADAAKLKKLETKGDSITHELVDLLNRYFVTPFDREQILSLAIHLDNVIDLIEASAVRICIYDLKTPDPLVQGFAGISYRQAQAMNAAITMVCERRWEPVHDELEKIYKFEKEGDGLRREGLQEVFANSDNVVELIKKKEVYETLELATDHAKDVADILKALVISNA